MKYEKGNVVRLKEQYVTKKDRGKYFQIKEIREDENGYVCQWINEDCNVDRFFREHRVKEV